VIARVQPLIATRAVRGPFDYRLPEELRDQIKLKVAETGDGTYGQITLGSAAKPVREAAQRLKAKPGVSKKLAAALPDLARIPGY